MSEGIKYTVVLVVLVAGLVSCEYLTKSGVTCAPRPQVIACLNESYQESTVGLGPQCSALAVWAQAQGWEIQGTGVTPQQEALNARLKASH
jgi:hypothetical protein